MAINLPGLWALGKGGRNVHWWQKGTDGSVQTLTALCNSSFIYSGPPGGGSYKKCPKCMALVAEAAEAVQQDETCESCHGELGDDAPVYEDADICRTCHDEIQAAEAVRG